MSRTFYDVLGVAPDASTDEITTAYRERIKETHPDVSDAADAEEQAKRVIEAKEVLTDEAERDRYDRLGHDAYVRQTNVDGDWEETTDDPDAAAASAAGAENGDDGSGGATNGTGTSGRRRGRSEPGPSAGAESVYEGTWATNGVSDTEDGSSEVGSDSASASGGDAEASSADSSSSPDGSRPGEDATADSESPSGGRKRRRRGRSRGSNGSQNVGDAVGWAASVDGQHAVRQGHDKHRFRRSGLFPPGKSSVLLVSTFVCYPAMVFSTVYPGFPLVVNAIVGCCALLVIAYLMSMPEVGVYVFGGWSALATLASIAYGVSPFSLLGMLLLGTTWIPLGLTLATYQILRW